MNGVGYTSNGARARDRGICHKMSLLRSVIYSTPVEQTARLVLVQDISVTDLEKLRAYFEDHCASSDLVESGPKETIKCAHIL